MALDIDNFKIINDVYGHDAGDKALQRLVKNMRKAFGSDAIIIRNGGDEFMIFRPGVLSPYIHVIDDFTKNPHEIHVKGEKVQFYSSLGCSTYPMQGTDYKKLCIKADGALYGAKLDGKGGWKQFDDSIGEVQHRTQLGFNLTDVGNGMPGGMMICRVSEKQEILFANKAMIHLLGCSDYEDLMHFTKGSFFEAVHPDDLAVMQKEFKRQLAMEGNTDKTDFLTFRMKTKSGKYITVEDLGRKSTNTFYGDLYYLFIYDKAERIARQSRCVADEG